MGFSGVRPVVAEALAGLLNARVTPVVPRHGSLGASGDLAPLAHVGLCLIGEGEAFVGSGGRRPAAEALSAAGLRPLELEVKEGLALINGTDGMLAMLLLDAARAETLFATADVTAAMSVEALLGTDRPFAADLQVLRPQPGQARSAANLARMLEGSGIVASHRHSTHAVQDSYSMRCAPQVAGAARDTLDPEFVVCARCDAIGAEGSTFEEALERCVAYASQGRADLIWLNSVQTREQVHEACRRVPAPVMVIWGGEQPAPSLAEYQRLGVRVALYPVFTSVVGAQAAWDVLHDFKERGPSALDDWAARARSSRWGRVDVPKLLGTDSVRELEEQFLPRSLQRDYEATFGHRPT
jgi:hypothetical protein